jgi:hypothetical protein
MSTISFWLKSIGYSTLVIGTGVILLKTTTPPPPPMNDPVRNKENDEKWRAITTMIKRNMDSSRPAWDIQW